MRAARALNHLPKLHDATKVKTRFKLADHQTDSLRNRSLRKMESSRDPPAVNVPWIYFDERMVV